MPFLNDDEDEGHTKAENARLNKEGLVDLVGRIDGLLRAEVGINVNPNGMDLCLLSEFTDEPALDAYQNHPLHQQVRDYIRKVTDSRVVCDSVV